MRVACPHCAHDIEIIGTTGITREFDLTPNMIQHAINRGKFPEPWIKFNNRSLWLRSAIESYQREKASEKTEKAKLILRDALSHLTDEERLQIIEELGVKKSRRSKAA